MPVESNSHGQYTSLNMNSYYHYYIIIIIIIIIIVTITLIITTTTVITIIGRSDMCLMLYSALAYCWYGLQSFEQMVFSSAVFSIY